MELIIGNHKKSIKSLKVNGSWRYSPGTSFNILTVFYKQRPVHLREVQILTTANINESDAFNLPD